MIAAQASDLDAEMRRATINWQKRNAILQAAYSCNRPDKSPQQQRDCEVFYEQLREQIASDTRSAHAQVRPYVDALIGKR